MCRPFLMGYRVYMLCGRTGCDQPAVDYTMSGVSSGQPSTNNTLITSIPPHRSPKSVAMDNIRHFDRW